MKAYQRLLSVIVGLMSRLLSGAYLRCLEWKSLSDWVHLWVNERLSFFMVSWKRVVSNKGLYWEMATFTRINAALTNRATVPSNFATRWWIISLENIPNSIWIIYLNRVSNKKYLLSIVFYWLISLFDVCQFLERENQLMILLVFEHLEQDLSDLLGRLPKTGMPPTTIQVTITRHGSLHIFDWILLDDVVL